MLLIGKCPCGRDIYIKDYLEKPKPDKRQESYWHKQSTSQKPEFETKSSKPKSKSQWGQSSTGAKFKFKSSFSQKKSEKTNN